MNLYELISKLQKLNRLDKKVGVTTSGQFVEDVTDVCYDKRRDMVYVVFSDTEIVTTTITEIIIEEETK